MNSDGRPFCVVDESPSISDRRNVLAMDCVLAADISDGRDIWTIDPEGRISKADT